MTLTGLCYQNIWIPVIKLFAKHTGLLIFWSHDWKVLFCPFNVVPKSAIELFSDLIKTLFVSKTSQRRYGYFFDVGVWHPNVCLLNWKVILITVSWTITGLPKFLGLSWLHLDEKWAVFPWVLWSTFWFVLFQVRSLIFCLNERAWSDRNNWIQSWRLL